MELNMPVKEEDKYMVLITFLSPINPFSELRKREIEVYAELVKYWHEYKDLPPNKRNKLIFDYEVRQEIAEKYGTTVDNIYNIASSLKKKGFIDNGGLVEKYANFINAGNNYLKINFV